MTSDLLGTVMCNTGIELRSEKCLSQTLSRKKELKIGGWRAKGREAGTRLRPARFESTIRLPLDSRLCFMIAEDKLFFALSLALQVTETSIFVYLLIYLFSYFVSFFFIFPPLMWF